MRNVGVQGGDINGDKQDIGGKGGGEVAEDGEEMVRIFEDLDVGTEPEGAQSLMPKRV